VKQMPIQTDKSKINLQGISVFLPTKQHRVCVCVKIRMTHSPTPPLRHVATNIIIKPASLLHRTKKKSAADRSLARPPSLSAPSHACWIPPSAPPVSSIRPNISTKDKRLIKKKIQTNTELFMCRHFLYYNLVITSKEIRRECHCV